jgi:hypothetical protein
MRSLAAASLALALVSSSVVGPAVAEPLYPSASFTIPFGSPRTRALAIATADVGGYGERTAIAGTVRGGPASSGGADAFVRVAKDDGEHLWTSRFGTPSADRATGAAVASSDGVAVAGWTTGSFGHRTNGGGRDAFVRVYRRNGQPRWRRSFGGSGDETVTDVTFYQHLVVVVGSTTGALLGSTPAGGTDGFVVAYSADGVLQWARQIGSDRDDVVGAITQSPFAFEIAGTTAGSIPGADQANAGGTDGFSAHVDETDGELSLIHQFGTAQDDTAAGIENMSGGELIGGTTAGSFPGHTNAGGLDGYVVMYGNGGLPTWVAQFGSSGDDQITGFTTDAAFGFAAGTTTGALGDGPALGGSDGFVTELDNAGDIVWTQQFGSTGDDEVTSVTAPKESFGVYGFGMVAGRRDGRAFWGLQRPAFDRIAQAYLGAGLAIAQRWATAHGGSFADFTATNATSVGWSFAWRSSASPQNPVEMSIDLVDATTVRLSALSATGTVFCMESIDGVVTEGHSAVWDPSSCSGGW